MFGSETVFDGYQATASGLRERSADAVVSVDTAGDHAAAMEEDEARQMSAGVIGGRIEPVGKIARRARQNPIRPRHISHLGAG